MLRLSLQIRKPLVACRFSTNIPSIRQRISQSKWAKLIKLDLSALVCITSAGGYMLTGGSLFEVSTLSGLLSGTMLCAASAAAFNQIIEREHDKLMTRTKLRPLVTNSISVSSALAFGISTGTIGTILLTFLCTPTTGILGVSTILLYALVYTPLKRVTRFNTEVGAIVGAIPPVMGWTAAMGHSGVWHLEAWFLAGTLFSWQMHHFMTIAHARRSDYANAGFVMQSLNDVNGDKTLRKGLAWAGSMFFLPFLGCFAEFTNPMFMLTGSVANLLLFRAYIEFYKDRSSAKARKAMFAGFWQLIALFGLMTFHLQDRDRVQGFRQLDLLRKNGLHMCAYHYHKVMSDLPHWCVFLFGTSSSEHSKLAQSAKQVLDESNELLLQEFKLKSDQRSQ
jgi:heme o synthase